MADRPAPRRAIEDGEQLPPSWTVWLLAAVAIFFVALIAFAGWELWTSRTPVCNPNFPARRGEYPSWVFVFGAIGGFALGSLTSQVGIRRRQQSQLALGEGRWARRSAVAAVNLAVAAFLFIVTVLMGVEAWTLSHGHWPITYYVRCASDASGFIALVGVMSYAWIIGRWTWVF
jgi:hypothetical protein